MSIIFGAIRSPEVGLWNQQAPLQIWKGLLPNWSDISNMEIRNMGKIVLLSIHWSLNSSITRERDKDRQIDRQTRELDSLMAWTVHYRFMLCSALFMMKFLLWEHSFNLLCLTDFKKKNKSAPCLLYKGIKRKMWNIHSGLNDVT